ncbi:MAG: JAB domain-containing protein [Gemmatimonadaceae bacterium]|nr:JAB domain-containing protein [Gemmatimonadaceae bacterium]
MFSRLMLRESLTVEPVGEPLPLRSPHDVFTYAGPRMQDLQQEEFRVLVLDAQHRLVRDCLVSLGTLTSTLAHPREVFRCARGGRPRLAAQSSQWRPDAER